MSASAPRRRPGRASPVRPARLRPKKRRVETAALVVGGIVAGMLVSLGIAVLRRPAPPRWTLPHAFGVEDPTFVPSALAGTLMVPHPGGISEAQVFLVATYVYTVSHGQAKP